MFLTEDKIETIKSLCEANRVKHLYAFGSVTRADFDKDSDIDFIVDFDETDPYRYTDLYFNLKFELEDLLQRKIDLLEDRAIQNQTFRKELDSSKVLIYEKISDEIIWGIVTRELPYLREEVQKLLAR